MWKKNSLYWGLIILLIVGGIVSWNYFKTKSSSDSEEKISKYQYQVDDPQLISYSNGNKRWDIESETITQPKTEDDDEKVRVILEKVKDGKLYSNNKLEYKVNANKIIYFEKNKNIELYGDVELKEISGDKIFADELQWNDKKKNLKTKTGVRVKMKDGHLSAQNMHLNLEKEVIDFTGNVTMTFKIRGAQGNEK